MKGAAREFNNSFYLLNNEEDYNNYNKQQDFSNSTICIPFTSYTSKNIKIKFIKLFLLIIKYIHNHLV